MKKSLIVSSMALMASLTIAVAGSSQGEPGHYIVNGKANGNGTQTTQYTATYIDSFFGSVTCTGVHQDKKKGQSSRFLYLHCSTGWSNADRRLSRPAIDAGHFCGLVFRLFRVDRRVSAGLRLQRCSERGRNQLYCRSQLLRRVHTPQAPRGENPLGVSFGLRL